MALELYMLGLIPRDMGKSLEFYQRLGLAIPEEASADQRHIEVKMKGGELTFFLNRGEIGLPASAIANLPDNGRTIFEFYLKDRAKVDAKYAELMDFGYQSYHAPFEVPPIGMYFALVSDPDGHTVLLTADLAR